MALSKQLLAPCCPTVTQTMRQCRIDRGYARFARAVDYIKDCTSWAIIFKYAGISSGSSRPPLTCFSSQLLHRGCLLNDNLDGTLSILTRHNGMSSSLYADSPARIVSRDPDNGEVMINPQRPIYRTPTNIAWVDLHSEERGVRGTQPPQASATPAISVERVEEERPIGVRNDDRVGLIMASEDRLYSEWRGMSAQYPTSLI